MDYRNVSGHLGYRYSTNAFYHIVGQRFRPFDGNLIIPRQLEIHLPNPSNKPCNLYCEHCQGQKLPPIPSPSIDSKVISLIKNLRGQIPYFIFSGMNSEPTKNFRLIDMIEAAKSTSSNIGLHTNGILLKTLEGRDIWTTHDIRFLTRLHEACGPRDYLSVSIDASSPLSYALTKGMKYRTKQSELLFRGVIEGLKMLKNIKKGKPKASILTRVTYIMNKYNSGGIVERSVVQGDEFNRIEHLFIEPKKSESLCILRPGVTEEDINSLEIEEPLKAYLLQVLNLTAENLRKFMRIMKLLEVDTVRFSIPYAPWAISLEESRTYQETQVEWFRNFLRLISPHLSKDPNDRPFVFAVPPEKQDVDSMKFTHCFSGHDSITLGSDGYFYRCCSAAHPRFGHLRLGPLTDNVDEFYEMILKNQREDFNPARECFSKDARCTRAALEINQEFERIFYPRG